MKVGVIFGGRSCEHDISIITGVMTVNAAMVKHKVVPIYIDGDGVWYTGRRFNEISVFLDKKYKKKRIHLLPASRGVYTRFGRKIAALDAVIVCCHGLNGEDGTLAGLLELCGIPYAGSGVAASAIGMDKIFQKKLYEASGIEVTPFIGVDKADISGGFFDVVEEVKQKLNFPLIVKPANLGSSIGIGLAHDYKELFMRLDEAFLWDNRVVVENALTDFIEVNCAVLGCADKLIASQIEQPLSDGFLSYKDKYESGGEAGGYGKGRYEINSSDLAESGECCGENKSGSGSDRCEAAGNKSCDSDFCKCTSDQCDKNQCESGQFGANQCKPEGRRARGKGEMGRYLPAHISPEMAQRVRDTAKKVFRLLGCSGIARVDFLIKDDCLYVNEINTVPGSLSSYLFAFDGMDFPLLIDKLLATALMQHKSKAGLKYTYDSNVLKNSTKIKK